MFIFVTIFSKIKTLFNPFIVDAAVKVVLTMFLREGLWIKVL
jgi:hypothetical protein